MILLSFDTADGLHLGVKTDRGVLDTGHSPQAFLAQGSAALPELQERVSQALADPGTDWLDEQELQLGPAVPNPGKVLCVGLNYRRHAAETGAEPPKTPVLFSKFGNTVAAPAEGVPLPAVAVEYDYEAELVVVIGKRAKDVSEAEALDYVLGYCNGNDISARDLQMLTGQWLLGKTLDKFLPLGPYLVTSDEAGDPQAMRVRCWLNGELRQDSNSEDMIFSVAECVSYASRFMTLMPGDIISTGTPEGVILGMAEKVWMKPGDEVTIEVGALGRLTNTMVAGD
jgi:2-keto-4-pentenoate hydratase/2-oxohepta-3-ene-1,7-dioic acid hydratase in catechol pathway